MTNAPKELSIEDLLRRLGEVAKQRRIANGATQAEQAEKAEISLKAAQGIERGQSGQTAILLKYLQSLDLMTPLMDAYPDPFALSPLEELALKKEARKQRPQRVSKARSAKRKPTEVRWGDEE